MDIKADGGPDRNMTRIAVQLAYTGFARVLPNLEKLVLMRTAANQSYTNCVERCMSVTNLGLQGCSSSRGACREETERLLSKCGSMKDIRAMLAEQDGDAAGEEGSHTKEFSKSMQVAIDTVTNALSNCEWSSKRLHSKGSWS